VARGLLTVWRRISGSGEEQRRSFGAVKMIDSEAVSAPTTAPAGHVAPLDLNSRLVGNFRLASPPRAVGGMESQ
jgi:hypothetical protein